MLEHQRSKLPSQGTRNEQFELKQKKNKEQKSVKHKTHVQ